MSERANLEAGLEHVENYFAAWPAGQLVRVGLHPDNLPGKNYGPKMGAVLDAARKHLDTLPKPAWRITGTRPDGSQAYRITRETKDEALRAATMWLSNGYTDVSVKLP